MASDTPRFGDTSAGVWLLEVLQDCLRELPGNRSVVDMNLLIQKVRAEPKNAQVAMQLIAQELRSGLGDQPVSQAKGLDQTHRLLLGSLCSAYFLYRHVDDGHPLDRPPPELEQILRWHPIIMDCLNFVSSDQRDSSDA